jgi:hypothetical protein
MYGRISMYGRLAELGEAGFYPQSIGSWRELDVRPIPSLNLL